MVRNLSVALVGVLAFTLTLGGTVYAQLQDEVDAIDVSDLLNTPDDGGTPEPPADPNAGTPLTLLVIGSDSRADGAVGDGFESVLADTHIVAHISADRSRVELASIPRDIMVDIPECRTTGGEVIPAQFGMYNSAFANGFQVGGDTKSAVGCDINLAQAATGLTIDGWVLVEMGGFIEMVDALGGVDICIPEAIDAPKAKLVLEAGQQTLSGEDALGYARARVGVGLGSDPDRITRQQHLMSAMVDEVLSRNVLTDGPALYKMVNAALGSLTMSPNLSSLSDMAGLALSLRSLDSAQVTFVTTPFATYPQDPNRLVWTDEVDAIWAAMAADEPIPVDGADEESSDEESADDGESASEDETTDAADDGSEATTDPVEAGTEGANAEELNPVC